MNAMVGYAWTLADNQIGRAEQEISDILSVNGGDVSSPAIDGIIRRLGEQVGGNFEMNVTPQSDGRFLVIIDRT